MPEKLPNELARDTLLLLAKRKLAPNPTNFRVIYSEVAGVPDAPPFPEEPLRKVVQVLPARTPGQQKQKSQLESALRRADWNELQTAMTGYVESCASSANARSYAPVASTTRDLFESLARLVESIQPALGGDDPRVVEQGARLLEMLRSPTSSVDTIKSLLGNFNFRASFAAEDQAEIRQVLLKLLRLIIENIGELSRDDQWLKRQIDALAQAASPPLTLRRLDDVERRIKDVMFKQAEAKGRAIEAQEEMRRMIAMFIERLAIMAQTSGEQHRRMEESARLIEQARSLEDIAPVLKTIVSTTRDIASAMHQTHQELNEMRERTRAAEDELTRLHQELDTISTQARHDPLTGALNRKGLDEAITREVADVRRKQTLLCVSLLDIDNFKKLNDSRGHAAGDAALAHLAQVTRESMRPQDTLARYGGEEFVILMPDTELDQGVEAMTRLQRELTKRFFLDKGEKIVITFSAGVAQLADDETAEDAIQRADGAMYLAKRAGRNRVVGA